MASFRFFLASRSRFLGTGVPGLQPTGSAARSDRRDPIEPSTVRKRNQSPGLGKTKRNLFDAFWPFLHWLEVSKGSVSGFISVSWIPKAFLGFREATCGVDRSSKVRERTLRSSSDSRGPFWEEVGHRHRESEVSHLGEGDR